MIVRVRWQSIIRCYYLVSFIICLLILKSELNIPWKAYPISRVHVPKRSPNFMGPTLSQNDYRKLYNLSDFHFIRNHHPCQDVGVKPPNLQLLFLVHSAPENWGKRWAIRKTWGSWTKNLTKDIKFHIFFLIGDPLDPIDKLEIEMEDQVEGDIIQGSFVDAYRNLSYKHVMALKWFVYHCPKASYLVKTDDDVFVHIPKFVKFLTGSGGSSKPRKSDLILCSRRTDARPLRTFRSRWRVTPQEYPEVEYPPYCVGWIIIYSRDVVFKLYQTAQMSPYYWIDDVLVSGMLASRRNITLSHLSEYLLDGEESLDFISRADTDKGMLRRLWHFLWKKDYGKFIFACQIEPEYVIRIWEIVTNDTQH